MQRCVLSQKKKTADKTKVDGPQILNSGQIDKLANKAAYTSRFTTERALVSIKSLRGSTWSPIKVVNI